MAVYRVLAAITNVGFGDWLGLECSMGFPHTLMKVLTLLASIVMTFIMIQGRHMDIVIALYISKRMWDDPWELPESILRNSDKQDHE